ncbi:hypothetical protein E2I00_015412 [Balaenoptera physalus]|uniref:Exonuclease domain-containing protein n=1 Tax=Balaenoptera physalus TaxID=9770 RepID=A0A643C078_BALPH|nr:hypothetical protein E2I00_015412 [Balaenoptera physalus]
MCCEAWCSMMSCEAACTPDSTFGTSSPSTILSVIIIGPLGPVCFFPALRFSAQDWDLKVMLPGQCQYLGLPVADYFKQWINLKKAYSFAMGCWPKNGLLDMNKGLSLQHIGRPHSGIDDCKNIANIMKTLAYQGFIFKQTSKPWMHRKKDYSYSYSNLIYISSSRVYNK